MSHRPIRIQGMRPGRPAPDPDLPAAANGGSASPARRDVRQSLPHVRQSLPHGRQSLTHCRQSLTHDRGRSAARLAGISAAALALQVLTTPVYAQAPSPPAQESPDPAAKEKARAHFDKAVTLQEEEAWAPALAEFRASLDLYPTRAATKNAAVCLQKLERYDEALAMFQKLQRDYPNLTAEDKALAERSITRLKGLVGAVEIAGAEPGARVVVDGRERGATPLSGPIQVSAGTHVVRVYKDGFLPFEARIDVAGGGSSRVEATLAALTQSGRLKITESTGKAIDVVVDNVVVGKTPWEGTLAPGAHSVSLREGEDFGTQPVAARIQINEVTSLNLTAEELPSWLRVEPTPAGASVFIDAVEVGRGVWEGRVRAGAHRIEVSEDGFVARRRDVTLQKSGREIVLVELERDRSSARWARPAHPFLDVSGGFAFTPSMGGQLDERCGGGCSGRIAAGGNVFAHAGYALTMGLELGASIGFLSVGRTRVEQGVALLDPVGANLPPQTGSTRDVLRLSAAALGLHVGYSFGERFPITARLAGGVLFGQLSDDRTGSFVDSQGAEGTTGVVSQSPSIIYAYVGPELRVGYRVSEHLVFSAGASGLALLGLTKPSWDATRLVEAGADGVGTYPAETLLGDVVFTIAPSIGARYEF